MNTRHGWIVMVMAVILLAAVGCGKKPEPATDLDMAARMSSADSLDASDTDLESAEGLSRFDDLFKKKPAAEEIETVETKPAPVLVMDDIHFEFDKYTLTADARRMLAQTAKAMKEMPEVRIQIEGHCDSRGTQEYNLALGQRRAQAAKDYLVNLGIDAARVSIISFGEERPLDPRENEEAWAKNRRAHFNKK
uniref:Peptidoglycan-associated lipoprotein n=1 Tax=uncultured Latescibacterota bacterium TaxID=199737 RepID=Q2YZW1_9BACT|nr:outer membrane protein and related peptidoglycan-associated [uncultured Latescibacterota bacterium]